MSKEYLEALKTIKIKCHPNSNPSPLVDEALDTVEKALQRLELIDSAVPSKASSEALETLKDMLIGNGINDYINDYVANLILTIRATLLKAQELEVENSKYKELEEEIGCSVDVIAKLRKANYIYRDDDIVFGFIGINFNDEDKLILYNDDEWNTFTSDLKLVDYKKTWFLRKDKSE